MQQNTNIQPVAHVDEVLNWQASRGWFDTSGTLGTITKYPEETLKQLAENGDLKALHLLAYSAPAAESKLLLTKAAIHGSTRALFSLGNNAFILNDVYQNSPEEKKRPVLREAAAYISVAARRGDLYNFKYMGIGLYESRFNMKLSENDLNLVSSSAQDIYNSLESQRIELGLGQFDNSIPPAIKEYFRASGVEVED